MHVLSWCDKNRTNLQPPPTVEYHTRGKSIQRPLNILCVAQDVPNIDVLSILTIIYNSPNQFNIYSWKEVT